MSIHSLCSSSPSRRLWMQMSLLSTGWLLLVSLFWVSITPAASAAELSSNELQSFITNFYTGALGRGPTGDESQQQISRFTNAAAQSQEQLLVEAQNFGRDIFTSQEYANRGRSGDPTLYVSDMYYAFLQRAPDTSGYAFWVNEGQKYGIYAVLNAFIVSEEYQAKVFSLLSTSPGCDFTLSPDPLILIRYNTYQYDPETGDEYLADSTRPSGYVTGSTSDCTFYAYSISPYIAPLSIELVSYSGNYIQLRAYDDGTDIFDPYYYNLPIVREIAVTAVKSDFSDVTTRSILVEFQVDSIVIY